jgi:hypothetical protein
MASTNVMASFNAYDQVGPAASYAQFDIVVGTSSPVENFPVIAFDATTQEYADFVGRLPPAYSGGGLTVSFRTSATTTTGGMVIEAAFRRLTDDTVDLDTTALTYDYNSVTIATLASVAGELTYDSIPFTNGTDMDSLAAGEEFLLRVRRAPANAADTATGDLRMHGVVITET